MINSASLLLTTVVIVMVFGSKRLRHIGEDLGAAVKGFRKGLQDDQEKPNETSASRIEDDQ